MLFDDVSRSSKTSIDASATEPIYINCRLC